MDLANQIITALSEYTNEVREELEIAKEEVAQEALEQLKASSPVGNRGDYAKGWRIKRVNSVYGKGYILHNATNYRLTHLLEKGHAKRTGGRTKAQPHIGIVEKSAIDKIEQKVVRIVK